MIATTYYLQLPLLHHTYDLWQESCDAVRNFPGIVWSISLQPITPIVIARSQFLQEVVPTLSANPKPIILAQLTGTWKDSKDSVTIEATALKLIDDIDLAARTAHMQTGYIYLNYAHAGQNVFGDGKRKEWLQKVSRKYDPDGIFQRCVPGGFKIF